MFPGVPEGRHNVAHGGSRGNQNRAWQESPGRGGTSGSRAQMQPITQECVVGQFTCSRLLAGQALAIPSPCEGLSVPACRWRYRTGQPRVSVLPTRLYVVRCGVTRLTNSRDVMTLVFFQNLGKCRVFPVRR